MRAWRSKPCKATSTLAPDAAGHTPASAWRRPTPRVALGQALRGVASSALDVSDGLLGDLGHILRASGVGACIHTTETIKLIAASAHPESAGGHFDTELLHQCTLAGGDDYELAFTAPVAQRAAVAAAAQASATPVTRIGCIEAAPGLRLIDAHGQPMPSATPRSTTSPDAGGLRSAPVGTAPALTARASPARHAPPVAVPC